MANSKLLGKEFGVPPELQKITGNPTISYSMLKQFKNFLIIMTHHILIMKKKVGTE